MATPLIARVVVTPLAGLVWPAPAIATLTLRDGSGVLTDCPNAQIRQKSPTGNVVSLALTRVAQGTYQAGSLSVPLLHPNVAIWTYEGRSSQASDLVTPAISQIAVSSDGLPIGYVPGAPASSGGAQVLSHTITQAELDAGAPVQVPCFFVPRRAVALVASGAVVSDLVSCDGVNAYVTLALSDGVNASPFAAGDVVVITAVQ